MSDASPPRPKHLELKKDRALTVYWQDGRVSVYPIAHLRRMSPSAEQRELRQEMARNPLTVLPGGGGGEGGPLTVTDLQLVGNYAVRLTFSDGHHTGIYSWQYLREIDPGGGGDQGLGSGV
ncbi:MAG: gamma-butyrobetaine hydroxylase-like domain-containing protein [Phycisphaeraceae bacterium]